MKAGRVASARAISTRRRSPPERESAVRLSQVRDVEIAKQPGQARLDFLLGKLLQLEHRPYVLFHGELAKHRGFLGQVRQPHARAAMHRADG